MPLLARRSNRRGLPRLARRSFARALAVAALGLGLALPSCRRANEQGPSLVIEPDPLDFGDVPWLESPKRTVTIANRSDHEVMLRNPKFTCSCFAILEPLPAALRPGASTTFEVQMWSRMGTPGRFHKKLSIETDDPARSLVEVAVTGSIVDFRSIEPMQVVLGAVAADDDPLEKTVAVRGGSGSVVRVVSAVATDPRLSVEVKPLPDGADVVVRTARKPAKGFVSTVVRLELEVGPEGGAKHRYTESVRVSGEFK